MLNVSKLKKGIVLDHIKAGSGMDIYRELHLNDIDMPVVLMKGIHSEKMGKKDLIKIETDIPINMDVLGLIDPGITINYVKDGKLVNKAKLKLPQEVKGILKCHNPRCISHYENVGDITFKLVDPEKKIYKCEYCDSFTTVEDSMR